jgi:hypothetical protein
MHQAPQVAHSLLRRFNIASLRSRIGVDQAATGKAVHCDWRGGNNLPDDHRKLLRDSEAWAQVYRDDTYIMDRSTAIRSTQRAKKSLSGPRSLCCGFTSGG